MHSDSCEAVENVCEVVRKPAVFVLIQGRVSLHSLGLSNCVDQDGFKLKETGLLCLLSADITGKYHHAWPPAFLSPSPMYPLCSCFCSEFTVPWGDLRVVVPLSRAHCSLVSQRSKKSHFPPKWMLSVPLVTI